MAPTSHAADDRLAYRPADAAKALGVSRSTLYELMRVGDITARKLGAATLIPRAELERYLDSLPDVEASGDGDGTAT